MYRGWIHIEILPEHNASIRRTFRSDGPFLKALIQLAKYPEYSYDMVPEAFSEDVRKALAAGATQYLPRLYTNCVHFEKRSGIMGTTDIRESATRQSTIFPRSLSGEYRIKFNTIQFFLHHTVNVATHNPPLPTSQPSLLPTTTPSTFSSRGPSATPNTYGNSSLHTPNTSYATPYNAGTSVGSQRIAGGSGINTNANPFSNQQQQQQYRPQPRPRSIIGGIYEQLMTEYMQHYIPCGGNINNGGVSEFHPIIGTFLLDECIETWIRNSWISSGQKLSIERMHYIILFVKHIVGGDLRRCYSDNRQSATTNYQIVYNSIKSELYALISRLALNWSKDDDYLQVEWD
ncbi:hypothetical protein INT45_001704 [Circinella minor]|uniref:Uncharacterized protein n=1 Tax=Circinella minor TaxID=1195481 RepID=A0A8H7VJ87_9FUNG|nr:hypothetical protein INT45_001704 [Circinella minor]